MSEWDGFADIEYQAGLRHTRLTADYAGTDDDPIPVALLIQDADVIELREGELRWLLHNIPLILERIAQRP